MVLLVGFAVLEWYFLSPHDILVSGIVQRKRENRVLDPEYSPNYSSEHSPEHSPRGGEMGNLTFFVYFGYVIIRAMDYPTLYV